VPIGYARFPPNSDIIVVSAFDPKRTLDVSACAREEKRVSSRARRDESELSRQAALLPIVTHFASKLPRYHAGDEFASEVFGCLSIRHRRTASFCPSEDNVLTVDLDGNVEEPGVG
jgi:hypothetical protein